MKSLHPCPFCGANQKFSGKFPRVVRMGTRFYVECERCLVSTEMVIKKSAAIEAWNRREYPDCPAKEL